ncbi:MAG: hypothetical protein WCL44_00835 [bacterium]
MAINICINRIFAVNGKECGSPDEMQGNIRTTDSAGRRNAIPGRASPLDPELLASPRRLPAIAAATVCVLIYCFFLAQR